MDSLVIFGSGVKALGDGRVGGHLVRFTTDADPDLTGDFFTKETDYGFAAFPAPTRVLYAHGLDPKIGRKTIGAGTLKMDDIGIWVEAQLEMRDAYEKAVYELAEAGKLGWSSGTASHLVDREETGKAWKITAWPLGLDASLTPRPAEPRNAAIPLKSLMVLDGEDGPLSMTRTDVLTSAKLLTGLTLDSHSEAVLTAAQGLKARLIEHAGLIAAKEGRVLSESSRARLAVHRDAALEIHNDLKRLLTDTEPRKAIDLRLERLRTQTLAARYTGSEL